MANKKEYKLKSKMRYSELEEWRKKAGLTRKEVADKCCVSPKTIEGWRLRGELPGYASALISRIMSDSIELQLSLPDFRKLMRHMERLNIKPSTNILSRLLGRSCQGTTNPCRNALQKYKVLVFMFLGVG